MSALKAPQEVQDMEEGELEDEEVEENGAAEASAEDHIPLPVTQAQQKPKVPSPPPSPPQPELQGLSRKARKKAKQRLEKIGKGGHVDVSVINAIYGNQARASVALRQMCQIRLPDVQQLILWVCGEGNSPQWVQLKNMPLIRQVVFLAVPGISAHLFRERKTILPNLTRLGDPVTTLAKDGLVRNGYSVISLFNVPLSKEKRQYMQQTAAGLEDTRKKASGAEQGKARPFPAAHYVLKQDMMQKLGYPLAIKAEDGSLSPPTGFLMTQPAGAEEASNDAQERPEVMIAVDCEMCETFPSVYELTRVSLLDELGQVLLDELVLPFNDITNYHTSKSGITEELLKPVTTRLADVQKRFLRIVHAETILVGHALENDLKALKIVHSRCIDTGALYPHPKGLPYRSALRRLAEKFLKRQIQVGIHNPIEDARTALDLALLKLKHGPAYGLHTQQATGEPLLEVLSRMKRRCVMIDRSDCLNRHLTGKADAVACGNDAEVLVKALKEVRRDREGPGTDFVWAQFRELSLFYEARADAERREAALARAAREVAETSAATDENGTNGAAGVTHGGEPREAAAAKLPSEDHADEAGSKRKREEKGEDLEDDAGHSSKRAHLLNGSANGSTQAAASEAGTEANGSMAVDVDRDSAGEDASGQCTAAAVGKAECEEMEEGEKADDEEERLLRQLDRSVGRIYDTLPPNSLLVVATLQGDTASTRLMQEQKMRSIQKLDGLPPWSQEKEKELSILNARAMHGLCFCTVKL